VRLLFQSLGTFIPACFLIILACIQLDTYATLSLMVQEKIYLFTFVSTLTYFIRLEQFPLQVLLMQVYNVIMLILVENILEQCFRMLLFIILSFYHFIILSFYHFIILSFLAHLRDTVNT
jgi:hypothetical protein